MMFTIRITNGREEYERVPLEENLHDVGNPASV